MKKQEKTNVMRYLDARGIPYGEHTYDPDQGLAGMEVARQVGIDSGRVFKTLVTVGARGQNYVFMIPVECELNLKKAAVCAGEKSIAMIPPKQLLPLTGYVHGGCSPIGMKKFFPTFIDESAILYDTICFSGGRIGYQVEMKLADLMKAIEIKTGDICG